ncbi:MAG: polymer-forming cytoskeletal protein [Chitinophagaceae bacterium]|nr:polymer-forming cytoskeletal protein [Chitinophagaceae bacterium]
MFNSKSSSQEKESSTGMATIVASGTEIKGNIESKGDIRVDGVLNGNLTTSSKVLVGPSGKIYGDVVAQQADVLGQITGTIKVTELLYLKGNCQINGNIYAGQLQVDATASFNGECHMGAAAVSNAPLANVVELGKEQLNAAANDQ